LTPHDVNQIRRKIEQIKCLRYKKFLETYLPKAIPEEFYLEIKHKVSKEEVFRIIESVLVKKEYVPSNFRDMLKEREKISPTAFPSGIAVPHSIKYDAYKTGLYVINSKETVKWSNLNVNLIIALSVDKNDSEEFNKIFPRMVELLAEEINVRYLHKSLNRQEFITRMIDLMVSEDYYE
ncbi:TPA: PTS sugar transporter subunit IIA, partial [Enterococcus faecium]